MLILHLLHPIFPSTVSRATWDFSSWSKPPLEELFEQGVTTGCHKMEMPMESLLAGLWLW